MSQDETLSQRVAQRTRRKLRRRSRSIWFGLGMFGMIGWSVVIPALLGLALGTWLERGRLTLMLAGLTLGCLNAWHWVDREWQELKREEIPDDSAA